MKKEQITIPFEKRIEFANKYTEFDKLCGEERRNKWANTLLLLFTVGMPIVVSLPFAPNFILPAIISTILLSGCGAHSLICYMGWRKTANKVFNGKITYKQLKQLEKSGEVDKCLQLAMVQDLASDLVVKEDKPTKRNTHYIEEPHSDHYIFTENKTNSQSNNETQK